MARPARPLEILGGTTAFLVLALSVWIVTRGPASASAAEITRGHGVASPEEESRVTPADLAVPDETATTERTEIVDAESIAVAEQAAARAALPRCEVEGLLLLPRTFPSSAPATLQAWPVAVEGAGAPGEGSAGADHLWRFDDLLPGRWVFIARAEIDGRIAWGRSEEMDLQPDVKPDLVRIALNEYVVEGVVTDSSGLPIANLPVAYEWDGSDGYAGDEIAALDVSNDVNDRAVNFISSGNFTISFSGSELQVAAEQPINVGSIEVQTFEGSPSFDEELTRQLASAWIDASALQGLRIQSNGLEFNTWSSEIVTTDATGRFRIALNGPGRVEVTAPQRGRELAQGETRWLDQSNSVEVTAEAPAARADFALLRAASVSGRLVRSDGEGADDISVFIRRDGAGSTNTSSTNAEGTFRFEGCRPGGYSFYGRGGGASGQDFCVHLKFELQEGEEFFLDDVLTPSSSATGIVVDEFGAPLAGATVTAYGATNDNLKRTGKTDASGRFNIAGMYGCEYRFVVENRQGGSEVRAFVGGNSDRVDVGTLRLPPSAAPRGQAPGDGLDR